MAFTRATDPNGIEFLREKKPSRRELDEAYDNGDLCIYCGYEITEGEPNGKPRACAYCLVEVEGALNE